jgi:hypothetical protein
MGPQSHMRSVAGRNVVMRRIPVLGSLETSVLNGPQWPVLLITYSRHSNHHWTALWLRSELFWDFTHLRMIVVATFRDNPSVPKLRLTTILSCVTSQKSSDLIYTAAEAWNKALWFLPTQYKTIWKSCRIVRTLQNKKMAAQKNRKTNWFQTTRSF